MDLILFQIDMVWETELGLIGIPITKGLPYAIFMKQIILEITDNGQLNKLLKKWTALKPDCGPIHKEGKPLNLEKMISLFIMSMIGTIISIIILIIEKIIHAHMPRNHVSNGAFIKYRKSKIPRPIKRSELTIIFH